MRPLTSRWPLLCAAAVAGVLSTGSIPTSGAAQTTPRLQAQADALRRSESGALLELYAAESALARAQADLRILEQRSTALARAEQNARRSAVIVRRSLTTSQRRVAALLRDLYVQGQPDPIAVILGATSLEEAMTGIEGLSRAAALNERLGIEAEQRARRLERLRADLAVRRERLDRARSEARVGTERFAAAVAGRRETMAAIQRRRSLTTQRLATLLARARQAEQRSANITKASVQSAGTAPQATPEQPPAAPATGAAAPAAGTRTLVVDAVAYHLLGNTASGLPVGVGVIAVDPTVIPLGTRVLVPGYGPAVAADVGAAVKGNLIDLWMPSTTQARAWGRRTVTITVYG